MSLSDEIQRAANEAETTLALVGTLRAEIDAAERAAKAFADAKAKVASELPSLERRLNTVESDIQSKITKLLNRQNSASLDAIEKDADALRAAVDAFADAPKAGLDALKRAIDAALVSRIGDARKRIEEQDAEGRRMTAAFSPVDKALKGAAKQLGAGALDAAEALLDTAESALAAARAAITGLRFQQFAAFYAKKADGLEKKIATARADLATARQAAAQIAAPTGQPAAPAPLPAAKFPDKITAQLIEKSTINASIGGTTGARLVEIDGVKYVCKTTGGGQGVSKEHVRNEADADQAYRRAGILVPDCRVYEVEGKTYKLSQYIEGGKTLGEWLRVATSTQKEAMRAQLAKGYALDALFANWDVVGTNQDNILVDKAGNAWRIDNGSAFGFRAQGAKKKPEEFEKREWPDDWRTLRSSGINKGVFDQLTAYDIFHAFNEIDVDAAIRGLPDSTKQALAKPLEEMRQMGARCANFDEGGYTPETTSFVLESTYDLSKESFREEVPKHISLGNYGFCRASGFSGRQNPGGLPDYAQYIKTAAITINKHAGFGKGAADFSPNMQSVQAALDLEPDLQKYAKTDANAKKLLGYISEIKQAQASGWHIQSPISQVKNLTVTPPGVAAAAPKKYKSLTDHLYDYAGKQGVDCGVIADYFRNQGSNSWDHNNRGNNACRLKVINLALRGIDASSIKGNDPFVYMGGYDGPGNVCSEIQKAIDFYKRNPAQLEADKKAVCMWKSATSLLLENASFDGNHPEAKFLYHMRTDAKRYFGNSVKDGTVKAAYPIGSAESGCPIQSKEVYSGDYVGVRRVPFSRVNALFFMDPRPSGGAMFLGDGERECGVDLTGLPVYCAGHYGDSFRIADHEAKVDAAFAAWFAANP